MSHERIGRLLRCRKPLTRPAVRLLCLPYAGGGSTVFHAWSEGLPQDVEVRAAQLPGRQDRLDEAGLTSMSAIVHELSIALDTLPPAPLVLYGHSFGALIAFALAQRMKESHLSPQSLIVGARRAPVSYTHLDVYKRQAFVSFFTASVRRGRPTRTVPPGFTSSACPS